MEELIGRIESSKFEDTPLLLGRLYRHRGYYPRAEKILEEHLRERECGGYRKDSIRKHYQNHNHIGLCIALVHMCYRNWFDMGRTW